MAKILAIDDDPYFLLSLDNFLSFQKHQVTTIQNPFLVQETLRQKRFDCLLLDMQMPGLNGFELMQTVREIHPDLPIIIISGMNVAHYRQTLADFQPIAFVEKPFNPMHLLHLIKELTSEKTST